MSRRRRRLYEQVPNRGLTAHEAATYLGMAETRFSEILPKLQANGFPQRDPLLQRFDKAAIDHWWDCRSRLVDPTLLAEIDLDARIDGYGEGQGAPSGH